MDDHLSDVDSFCRGAWISLYGDVAAGDRSGRAGQGLDGVGRICGPAPSVGRGQDLEAGAGHGGVADADL